MGDVVPIRDGVPYPEGGGELRLRMAAGHPTGNSRVVVDFRGSTLAIPGLPVRTVELHDVEEPTGKLPRLLRGLVGMAIEPNVVREEFVLPSGFSKQVERLHNSITPGASSNEGDRLSFAKMLDTSGLFDTGHFACPSTSTDVLGVFSGLQPGATIGIMAEDGTLPEVYFNMLGLPEGDGHRLPWVVGLGRAIDGRRKAAIDCMYISQISAICVALANIYNRNVDGEPQPHYGLAYHVESTSQQPHLRRIK